MRRWRPWPKTRSGTPPGDGFVIAVLYGTESNGVRNVMAAGGLTLQARGRDCQLECPEIITPAQVLAAYPALYRRKMRSHPGLRPGATGSSALTGGTGRQLLEQAVAAVHDVTAVVRNADKLTWQVRTVTADLAG